MPELPSLTFLQFTIADDFLSLTIAVFLGSFVFFLGTLRDISPRYRSAMVCSAVIVAVAGYHYFRIFNSWNGAFTLTDGAYLPSGQPFNEAYRYMDWTVTVPLLLTELVLVMGLAADRRRSLLVRLIPAAAAMILLGYPGELATGTLTKLAWGTASTIPFVYILFVLLGELGREVGNQPADVQPTLRNLRYVLLATWGVYPIAYLIPVVFGETGAAFSGIQVAYALADITAKSGYGLMIHKVAKLKTEAEQPELPRIEQTQGARAAA